MGSSYIANVGAGLVNALDYNNGEVTFNWDKAVEWYLEWCAKKFYRILL